MTRAGTVVAAIVAGACQAPIARPAADDAAGVAFDAPPRVTVVDLARPTPPARSPSIADVVQLAAGDRHACALHGDGTVSCWGDNLGGQLGDGTTVPRARPNRVPEIADAVEIAAAQHRTCIRRRGGGVTCWGSPGGAHETIHGVDDAVQITTRCARRHDRTVACWHELQSADVVEKIHDAVDIAGFGERTCAARWSGTVTCWMPPRGRIHHQVGDQRVPGVVEVALGDDHTCGRRLDGKVTCWARRYDYDYDYDGNSFTTPRALPKVTGATQVAAGRRYGCVRSASRPLACWGWTPDRPNVADDHALDRPKPRVVNGLDDGPDDVVDEVVAGDTFACARRGGRDVRCWGDNRHGQLGIAASPIRTEPAFVAGVTGAIDVHAGDRYTCARLVGGAVACWGSGRPQPPAPGKGPVVIPRLHGAIQLAGRDLPCMRAEAGDVTCFGTRRARGASDVSASGGHGCIVAVDGVRCWGHGFGARMSPDRSDDGTSLLPDAGDAVEVVTVVGAACFRRRTGGVGCVGRMQGGDRFHSVPRVREIGGIAGATGLALGDGFGCAIVGDGELRCWGGNESGQLGDGTTASRTHAVAVPGMDDVDQIAIADKTACARRRDRTVWCWGSNHTGIVGDIAITSHAKPVAIAGVADAVDVSLARHACVARGTGDVACWGLGDAEQVTADAVARSDRPVAVVWNQ